MVLHIHIYIYVYTYHYLHVYVYIILHDLTWSFICWLSMAIPMALGGQLPSLRTGRTAAIGAGTSDVVGGLTGKQNQAHHLCRRHWRPLVIKPGMDQDLAWAGKNKHILFIFHINDPFLEVSNIFTQESKEGTWLPKTSNGFIFNKSNIEKSKSGFKYSNPQKEKISLE